MTPAEQLRERIRRYSDGARRGWIKRRQRLGLPPTPAPPGRAVRVYVADAAALAALAPIPAHALAAAMDGLRLAVEVGAIRWNGEAFEVAPEWPQDAPEGRGAAR